MKLNRPTSLLTLPLVLTLAGCASLENLERPDQWNSFKEKKAAALFKELCATQAYEKVYRQVYGVNGYLWNSPWPLIGAIDSPEHMRQVHDNGLPSAPDHCLLCLTQWSGLTGGPSYYQYVEIRTPDGVTTRLDESPVLSPTYNKPIITTSNTTGSRYSVSFENLATPEMQQLWVGGSRMAIRDLETGELLGERVTFSRGAPLLAADYSSRGPWGLEQRCPADDHYFVSFTLKVLNPRNKK